tara:strand:+ start:162 stop:272 length:111 start_codon:yes stop_codon:yes gene_type:complete
MKGLKKNLVDIGNDYNSEPQKYNDYPFEITEMAVSS